MIFLQSPGQAAAAQAQADAAAAQATARAAQLQAQIQQATDKAIQQALQNGNISGDTKTELKEQIRAAIDAAREAAQEARAQGRGDPFVYSGRGFSRNNDIPEQVPQMLSIMGITLVCCVVGFPLARAIARWIDRRGTTQPVSREVVTRLEAIEQAVESVAVEVERISEGQRFTTRMLSERTHEPAANFLAADRDRVPVDLAANAPANARRG